MESIYLALLPNLVIGLAGVPAACLAVSSARFVHAMAYVASYAACAAVAAIWFALEYGTALAAIGGFFLALFTTFAGLCVGLIAYVIGNEYARQRRYRTR